MRFDRVGEHFSSLSYWKSATRYLLEMNFTWSSIFLVVGALFWRCEKSFSFVSWNKKRAFLLSFFKIQINQNKSFKKWENVLFCSIYPPLYTKMTCGICEGGEHDVWLDSNRFNLPPLSTFYFPLITKKKRALLLLY